MTNEEMLLMALTGRATLKDGITFQPQNNKQAYLAYACGLLTDADALPTPLTKEEYLLREYCLNGGGGSGGGELPTLTNPATAAEIVKGYEALNSRGNIITGILSVDDFEINDASYLFYNGARSADADKYVSRIKNCTDMKHMFYKWPTGVELVDISSVDTSTVEDMSYLFYFCGATAEEIALCVSGLDTSNVKNMAYIFAQCSKLQNIDINTFDTSKVTDMSYMFSGCTSLESIDFSGIDTSKVTTMNNVFGSCSKLKEITGFSATNKAGMSIAFPNSTSTASYALLRRLTFRTDVENAIRSAINIKYCDFRREGLVEMFNTLPDVSELGLTTAQKTITITGNPAVLSTISLSATSSYVTFKTYEEFEAYIAQRYRGFDYSGISLNCSGAIAGFTQIDNITPDTFNGGYSLSAKFPASTLTIPEEAKLTDEDRAIATAKGWTLVE